ncbi:phosphoribosylaminoimidazolesuccinocarboxamide synthase [Parenemella sanctibonifatiensis]|uniref:Multifunctional fusion protein n=1 Tax=Parenemella sanctibonifatiensis TaxID=2016505 RepID=A0A255EBJ4_9ACTN|nr:phosphoribosylaminoimidazolesuccinocarboxamide synthase [Parenemella sanctibonifatiensis]OYN88630.1 phosphoribosylaminoimidazolesuccinocarboxamide synthase [Parenemella sanctibonifatiensis]
MNEQPEVSDLPLLHRGKVRSLYARPDGTILMVASDAISAFDHVLSPAIPDKGAILTAMSLWWFEQLADLAPNHVISTEVPSQVAGRALVCEKLDMVPIECVARGYLTGSGWLEYQQHGTVCGIDLPAGLVDGARLPEPIFTPATKAPMGEHDENIDFATAAGIVGEELATQLRDLTLELYARAEEIARQRGIILADTKVEFGLRADGTIVLADEVLTPDSSRFWDAETWDGTAAPESFDKQYVRNWLSRESGWDRHGTDAPPALPAEVVAATRERYLQAYERLTGEPFVPAGAVDEAPSVDQDRIAAMGRVVVEVMPKPEILDPQGKAISQALQRLGYQGLSVRQGKRFEIEVEGEVTAERLEQIETAAEQLLANTVIESFVVRAESAESDK